MDHRGTTGKKPNSTKPTAASSPSASAGGKAEQPNRKQAPVPSTAVVQQDKGEEPRSRDDDIGEEEVKADDEDTIAASFASQDADGAGDGDAPEVPPPSSKRFVLCFVAAVGIVFLISCDASYAFICLLLRFVLYT